MGLWGKFMNNLQKTIIERYTEKKFNSQNFTYRQYLDYMKKLTERNIKDQQKIAKTNGQIESLSNKPTSRVIDNSMMDQIINVSITSGLIAGATMAATNGTSNGELFGASVAGISAGGVAALANIAAYQHKPVSKLVNKALIKTKSRKVKRLENRKVMRDYTLYCFRSLERENTPTFEDFLKMVKDSDERQM